MKDEPNEYVTPRRRINSGQVCGTIIFVGVLGCVVWYLISTHLATVRQQQADDTAAQTKQQQKDASLAALALKYNAVTNWEASLPDRGAGEPFSIEVSSVLIRSNGQPVLLELILADVAGKNSSYTAQFSQFYLTNQSIQLSVELQCTVEQAKQFVAMRKTNGIQCAIVARFTEVSRPKFKLTGSVSGSGEDADLSVELNDSPDVFLARGELLEAIPLP